MFCENALFDKTKMVLTAEEKIEKVKHLRPMDDGTDIAELMSCVTKKGSKESELSDVAVRGKGVERDRVRYAINECGDGKG